MKRARGAKDRTVPHIESVRPLLLALLWSGLSHQPGRKDDSCRCRQVVMEIGFGGVKINQGIETEGYLQ